MKTIRTLTLLLLLFIANASCMPQRIFKDASNVDGVTSVLVSKAMLKMAGASMGKQEGLDVGRLMDKATSIEFVTVPKKLREKVEPLCQNSMNELTLETLVEVKGGKNNVNMYIVPLEEEPDLYKGLIITVDNGALVYMYIAGRFTLDDITEAMQSATDDNQSPKS